MHAAESRRLLCQRREAADLSDRFGRELDVDRYRTVYADNSRQVAVAAAGRN